MTVIKDYRQQPTPKANKTGQHGPNPWATPERPPQPKQGTLIEPENPAPFTLGRPRRANPARL